MGQFWLKVTSLFTLVIVVSSSVFAESGAAMLYPTGVVLLNGNTVPGATALFKGDVISTSHGSIADFNTQNARISITADTTVKLDGGSVKLNKGVVTIDTTSGFQTRASRFTVTPAAGSARYRVASQGGDIVVASLERPIVVTWEAKTHLVAAGSSWSSGSDAQDTNAQQGPQPAPAGKVPGSNTQKGLSTGTLILIGAGMAGLAGGLAYAASSGQSVSPVRP